ncbi:MAG: hypothetical protein KH586_12965 [Tannerella sp.]|uniref:hypothetical protein n=1 Tax=uncultured Coprobacter sp. TaxID=1720550 RepID=UPI002625E8F7|nr:hypothetical protein [uncultured Coprobacter sp.]MBS6269828.1 hypothetical protein [Tannerella sp.]
MIKKILSVVLAFSMLNLNLLAAAPLDRGTMFIVRLLSTVKSNSKETISTIVDNDVKGKNGEILIKRGTPVQTSIKREKAKGCGRAGFVELKCISTTSVDGQTILLEGSSSATGKDNKGLAIGLGVGLGVTFLPVIGFAFLAIKGESATIEAGTIFNVFVMNDYNIEN